MKFEDKIFFKFIWTRLLEFTTVFCTRTDYRMIYVYITQHDASFSGCSGILYSQCWPLLLAFQITPYPRLTCKVKNGRSMNRQFSVENKVAWDCTFSPSVILHDTCLRHRDKYSVRFISQKHEAWYATLYLVDNPVTEILTRIRCNLCLLHIGLYLTCAFNT